MSCLLSKPFLFFTFFQVHHPFFTPRPDIDAINGQDDVYLEFVPILDIYYSCNAIKFISFDPLQPTIPCQTEMSCHHFPNWLPFISGFLLTYHQSTLESMFLKKTLHIPQLITQCLKITSKVSSYNVYDYVVQRKGRCRLAKLFNYNINGIQDLIHRSNCFNTKY